MSILLLCHGTVDSLGNMPNIMMPNINSIKNNIFDTLDIEPIKKATYTVDINKIPSKLKEELRGKYQYIFVLYCPLSLRYTDEKRVQPRTKFFDTLIHMLAPNGYLIYPKPHKKFIATHIKKLNEFYPDLSLITKQSEAKKMLIAYYSLLDQKEIHIHHPVREIVKDKTEFIFVQHRKKTIVKTSTTESRGLSWLNVLSKIPIFN